MLYEALVFGLPVFVTTQSMPYVGLQCEEFVTVADANSSKSVLNRDLQAFVTSLETDAQQAVRAYAARDLREHSAGPRRESTRRAARKRP